MLKSVSIIPLFFLSAYAIVGSSYARTDEARAPRDDDGLFSITAVSAPNTMNCVHKYNNLQLTISNWGFFGSEDGGQRDCESGGSAPSGEFPAGSQIEYLFQGALWIGAVVGDDTLVSVGADGWQWVNEMYPCADEEEERCGIERRSSRRSDPYFHEDAKSDLEYIAIYTDTLNDPRYTPDDWDGRPYIPIGVEVTQHTYSWSVDYAADFIILDFQIKNITGWTPGGEKTIENLYLGVYSDGDVGHKSNNEKHYDDICGYLKTATAHPCTFCDIDFIGICDPIDLTYICDNDGDPVDGAFVFTSPTGLLGTRVMKAPGQGNKQVSFNWWTGNGSAALDWGPMREATQRIFGTGGFGTPEGDKNKYYMLSNGENDYDQIYSAQDRTGEGWLPPVPVAEQLASGGDTRFLLSFGPFNLPPDPDTFLQITCAYVAGEGLHNDPTNNIEDRGPDEFFKGLNFDEVSLNSVWAAWVYDNPKLDITDPCNFYVSDPETLIIDKPYPVDTIIAQDTFVLKGDGIPDFQAAVAPPSPPLRYRTEFEKVYLRWNGLESETFIDPFTFTADFEGYRVYHGNKRREADMARIESRDFADYRVYQYRPDLSVNELVWRSNTPPKTLYELNQLYGIGGEGFDPEQWTCYRGMAPGDGFQDNFGNSLCFEKVDYNQSIEGWLDGAEDIPAHTGIRKRFSQAIEDGTLRPILDTIENPENLEKYWIWDIDPKTGDSVRYHKYYEYEFEASNLLASVPHYFSVTAFDYGEFANKDFGKASRLGPLEGSPLEQVVELWAIHDAATVLENYPADNGVAGTGDYEYEVKAYPNPYIGDGRYWESGIYEDPNRTKFVDHERRIHFVNLPPEATIRIYTLDGDLVRKIDHPGIFTDWDSKVYWDMRTRNNELVASGIYLYSVESKYGNQVGKFVVIF
jgi:hypothetical protein